MKVSKTAKWLYGISEGCTFLAIVFAAALMAGAGWLMLEPREVPFLAKEVEQALNHPENPYTLKVDKTLLALGSFSHPLNVIVKDVQLLGIDGEQTVKVPAMHVSLSVMGLLAGKIKPNLITLIEPNLALYQNEDGAFFLSGKKSKIQVPLNHLFATTSPTAGEENTALFGDEIEEIAINAGNLQFESALKKIKIALPLTDITIRQHAGIFRGRVEMRAIQAGLKDLAMSSFFTYDPAQKGMEARFDFKDLVLADFAEFLPELSDLKEIKVPLTGMVEVKATLPETLSKLSVDLKATPGTIQHPVYMKDSMNILQFELKGALDLVKKQAKLDRFAMKLKRLQLAASGVGGQNEKGELGMKGEVKLSNLTKRTLLRLWPEGVGADPRKWVDDSIAKATITEGEIHINAPAGSLETAPLPEDAINAKLNITGAKVKYMPDFPPVLEGAGVLSLTGNTLTVDIAKGNLLTATSLTGAGKVFIPDIHRENITINIDLPVAAPAVDVVEFIKSTAFKLPKTLNFDQSTLGGDLRGNVKLEVLDNISPIEDEITFTIDTDVSNFSQKKFYKGMDLSAANGKLLATDKKLEVDATGVLQGQAMQFATQITSKQEDYHLVAKVPHTSLKEFGIDTEPYVTGEIGVNLDWLETIGGITKINAKADLTKSILKVDDIEYNKPVGEPAALTLKGTSQKDLIEIDDFLLTIPNRKEEVQGSARISTATGRIEEVNANRLNFAGTQASGIYRPIAGGYYVHAKGSKLDLSYRDHEAEKKAAEAQGKKLPKAASKDWKIPALDLNLVFDNVLMSKDGKRTLSNLKLDMACDTSLCSRMDMEALAGKSAPFTLKIARQNNRRVLTAYTPRADIFLREVNIFDDMRKGDMQIIGIFQDELPNRPLIGKATIGPHRVKDVAVLTKLLTLATFTGIVDAVGGSGLQFNRLVVPFSMENFVLHLKDAKTVGPSIGIVADGTIDLNKDTINLRGTVIPAYMFNSLIQSIPVLGNIFGVLAGDGLVAVRYSMLGDLENPDVTVNPLSALTPGFLRGFFSIFEEADPNAKGTEATAKALRQLEGELSGIKVPEAQKEATEGQVIPAKDGVKNPSVISPDAKDKAEAAPVIGVKQKPASVLSPKVKPTEIRP